MDLHPLGRGPRKGMNTMRQVTGRPLSPSQSAQSKFEISWDFSLTYLKGWRYWHLKSLEEGFLFRELSRHLVPSISPPLWTEQGQKGSFSPSAEREGSVNTAQRLWPVSSGVWGVQLWEVNLTGQMVATERCPDSSLRGWGRARSGLPRITMVCARNLPSETPHERDDQEERLRVITPGWHWAPSLPASKTFPAPASPPSLSLPGRARACGKSKGRGTRPRTARKPVAFFASITVTCWSRLTEKRGY